MHGEEHLAGRRLLHAALAAAQMLEQHILERIARGVLAFHQTLPAVLRFGHDQHRAPRGAFGIERGEDVELHR